MGLLTIGTFARAAGLSPKALRLYDELGLLPPARVDPESGYRFYRPQQLERARLVAWLRRLGMPLAQIKTVCELAPADAAGEVAAYWSQVEAAMVSRRELAAFLVGYLAQEGTAMPVAHEPFVIRYAAGSDTGRCREANQDAAYGGPGLLAVADGFGRGGERASAAVIDALKPFGSAAPTGDLLNALEGALQQAAAVIGAMDAAGAGPDPGTTVTALLSAGPRLALVHIGDTRAYLLREGELFQITHDHTVVQSLLDEGCITPDEAASHPERSLLLRALAGGEDVTPDISWRDAAIGDRYLLCSDGLTTVVGTSQVRGVLLTAGDPQQAVQRLISLANSGGGPDNIACVVADIVALPAGERG